VLVGSKDGDHDRVSDRSRENDSEELNSSDKEDDRLIEMDQESEILIGAEMDPDSDPVNSAVTDSDNVTLDDGLVVKDMDTVGDILTVLVDEVEDDTSPLGDREPLEIDSETEKSFDTLNEDEKEVVTLSEALRWVERVILRESSLDVLKE